MGGLVQDRRANALAAVIGQRNRRRLVVIRPCIGGNVAIRCGHTRSAILGIIRKRGGTGTKITQAGAQEASAWSGL